MSQLITLETVVKAYKQNIANLIKRLPDGKTLTPAQLAQLAAATTTEANDPITAHNQALSILADQLPAHEAREINSRPISEERGRSITELRAMLKLALSHHDLKTALNIRKELNKLQGLYKKAPAHDLLEDLKQAISC